MHSVSDQRTKKVSTGSVICANKPGELSYLRWFSLKATDKSIQMFFCFAWTGARQRQDQAKIRPTKTKCFYIINTTIHYRMIWYSFKKRINIIENLNAKRTKNRWKRVFKTFFFKWLPKIEKEMNQLLRFWFLRFYQIIILLIIKWHTFHKYNKNKELKLFKSQRYMYCPFSYFAVFFSHGFYS